MSMVSAQNAAQEAAMRVALDAARTRAAQWALRPLAARQEGARVVGELVRDRALTIIERDLVGLSARRQRRAPWGQAWASDWWSDVILPAARQEARAAWWIRRAPLEAVEWARLLDATATEVTS